MGLKFFARFNQQRREFLSRNSLCVLISVFGRNDGCELRPRDLMWLDTLYDVIIYNRYADDLYIINLLVMKYLVVE